jgi:23S rRNA (uracil1939-C5)-methyltransferase
VSEILCKHHGVDQASCGACPWLNRDYSEQLRDKRERVVEALAKMGLEHFHESVSDVLPASELMGYRTHAKFKTDGTILGHVEKERKSVGAIEDCPMLVAPLRQKLKEILATLPRADWRHSDRQWNYIEIDSEVEEVILNQRLAHGDRRGPELLEQMKKWLEQRMGALDSAQKVIELFSAKGVLTQVLREHQFLELLTIEGYGSDFDLMRGDIYREKPELFVEAGVVVVSAPPQGWSRVRSALSTMASLGEIFYLASEVESFCRDAREMAVHGFHCREIKLIDAAPHTPQVEILSHFSKL